MTTRLDTLSSKASQPFQTRNALVVLIFVAAAVLVTPAMAQDSHSMHQMPGMQMDGGSEKPMPQTEEDMGGGKPTVSATTPSSQHASGTGGAMGGMDHSKMNSMDHSQMKQGNEPGKDQSKSSSGMDMGTMMKSMQGGSAPPGARDPDAYADGLEMGHLPGMDMADNDVYSRVMLDRFEAYRTSDSHGQAVDAQAWIGGDVDKLWLKVDGERENGKLGATRTEALWNHAIATYWGLQTGVRHDFGAGPGRTWAAFGIQGLAPYWFDVQATLYVGQGGRTAVRFEPEYDLFITQRLILQPNAKVNFYGKNDPERGIGSGLSDIEAGLRLRYEFSRKVAPYIGVVWNRKFGNTASYASEAGESVKETRLVAGIRVWF
jgi:copper resistance protein B